MPKAEKNDPQAGKATGDKKEKTGAPRTNFSKMWPEDAKITVMVEANPKKEGSKARERFQHYFKAATVGDYLAAGGTYQDIAYDVGRQFVQVG